jgi:cell division protein FtsI/penicillin-binding protein 2
MARLRVRDGVVMAPRRADGRLVALTLDPRLQRSIERLLRDSRAPSGAVVMADVKSGKILAWASRGRRGDLVRTPYFPPASLSKVVAAAALLEGGHVLRGTPLCFGGGHRDLTWTDIRRLCRPGEPKMPFGQALGRSVNVIFGRLAAHHLSTDALMRATRSLAFGAKPPLDVPAGASHVPAPKGKLAIARTAAGFARNAKVSPLSTLSMMHTIANAGVRRRLRLLASSGSDLQPTRAVKSSTARALTRMLEVTTRRGTGRRAFAFKKGRPKYRSVGKTGTLTVGPPWRMLSWYAGFAPTKAPEVVIAVMLANDLRWWRKGNDLARDSLDAYFQLKNRPNRSQKAN